MTPEELSIVDQFQTQNETDYKLADSTALQGEMAQIVAGVLSGGAGGLAEAEAGAATVAGAKATANTALKLGETQTINDVSMTRVGRWMSPDELAQMQNSNKIVQGGGGQTFISTNGAADFKGAASNGSVMSSLMFQVVVYCRVVRKAGIK